MRSRHRFLFLAVAVVLTAGSPLSHAQEASEEAPSIREEMVRQAQALRPFVRSEIAHDFLDAVPELPAVTETRVFYRNRETRDVISEADAKTLTETELEGYRRYDADERFYYQTFYGTPLAFVRPLDLIGRSGMMSLDGTRIADFGFGNIGQLRLMAANGASAHGIDVDTMLGFLYSRPGDTGRIARARSAGQGDAGEVVIHIGQFPAEEELVRKVGGGYDAFISKNTLKNGYIHPAQEVDPRMLVHLGVDDETFVRAVFELLKPGGYFMIYNLSPPQSEEKYIPWADGRSPFARELMERVGFDVVVFDRDDSGPAREMAKLLGWGEQMNLETDLFGMYTLARKPK